MERGNFKKKKSSICMKTRLLQLLKLKKILLLVLGIITAIQLFAQKDTIRLKCPLTEPHVIQQDTTKFHYDKQDMKIVLISKDTLVRAVYSGRVSNVQRNGNGLWDVVFYFKDYYFWYSGLHRVYVRRNDSIKAGQPVGYLLPGSEMELMVYKFETQIDLSKLLECLPN